MKNKASAFLKRILSLLSSIAKAKSMAINSKTSDIKSRLVLFSLMKSKRVLLGSISNKIHTMLGTLHQNDEDQTKAIVLYNNAVATESHLSCNEIEEEVEDDDDDDKYPDLRHRLFEEEEEFNDPGGSIIDLVKNSKVEGADFSLEDEIDHVADLFIMRFHKQIRLQKLESFKRFQEMLERSL